MESTLLLLLYAGQSAGDMQHLCIALDFSPDLMFFALFFNPTLSQSFYRSANNLLYHTPIGTPSLLTSIS